MLDRHSEKTSSTALFSPGNDISAKLHKKNKQQQQQNSPSAVVIIHLLPQFASLFKCLEIYKAVNSSDTVVSFFITESLSLPFWK